MSHFCINGDEVASDEHNAIDRWHVIYPITQAQNVSLHWRHNNHDGVSNHQPHACLLNRLFERRSKKTSKLRVTGLCAGNSPGPVNSPHKGPVTRKMFAFDDVIMCLSIFIFHSLLHSCDTFTHIPQNATDTDITGRRPGASEVFSGCTVAS